jgi:hypothetical protein
VETAVSRSDFMVFLISPESVTKGRYTLTEMGFARAKWPNPSRRVLPVMAVPTPLEKIPSYLKAVTILEPEGNMAAETRAAVDRILQQSPEEARSPMLPLAILALISAIGCYFTFNHSPEILRFSFVGALKNSSVAILPGVIFGGVVAACNAIFGIRDPFQLALVIVITTVAWIAAYDASSATFALFDEYSKTIVSDSATAETSTPTEKPAADPSASTPGDAAATPTTASLSSNSIIPYILGVIGGAVGGAITILGLLITNPGFRRLESIMVCWATATIAGVIFGVAFSSSIFILFAVWQPAVILAIARGFRQEKAQLPQWLERITASASYTSRGAG